MSIPACTEAAEFSTESLGEERRFDGIMCRMIKRGTQFAPLRGHQHAPTPEIDKAVDLDLSDCGENVVGHPGVISGMGVIAESTFGVAFEFDILVDLSVEIDTGIVYAETGLEIAGIPVFGPYARTPETDAEGEPLGIIDNPLGTIRNMTIHRECLG